MNREEEIKEAAEKFAFSDKTETPDFYDAMNDFLLRNKQAEKTMTKEEYIQFLNENLLVPAHDLSDICDYLKFPQKAFIDKYPKSDMVNKQEFIEKACKWLLSQEEMIGISFEDDFIERFKKAMEE